MPSGEAQHHCQLAPKPVRGADGGIIMEAFDPEGEVPYYYTPDEPGQPSYAMFSPTGYGDRDTFYDWLEGSPNAATNTLHQPRLPSPPPEESEFLGPERAERFRQERARWYRDHSGGAQLQGSWSEQSAQFDRLKDKLFGLRRARANPSGTPRAQRS